MDNNATDLMGVRHLHVMHFIGICRHHRIHLRQQNHRGVVEEASDNGGAFDEPMTIISAW